MLWLSRPPYLRWIAAAAIVVVALVWDLSGRRTEQYPFATSAITRGTPLSEAGIEWRPAASDLFLVPDVSNATASADIEPGDPITRSVVSEVPPVPGDWWAIPLMVPADVQPGAVIRVVLPNGTGISGIVVRSAVSDTFGSTGAATVAFPGEVVDLVARASSLGDLVVLVKP